MRESSFPLQKRKILTQTFTNVFYRNKRTFIYICHTQVTSIWYHKRREKCNHTEKCRQVRTEKLNKNEERAREENLPIFALPKASLKMAGCVVWCWCFMAFVRRCSAPFSRLRRGCSTGSTLRRFLGNFDRAYEINEICVREVLFIKSINYIWCC